MPKGYLIYKRILKRKRDVKGDSSVKQLVYLEKGMNDKWTALIASNLLMEEFILLLGKMEIILMDM